MSNPVMGRIVHPSPPPKNWHVEVLTSSTSGCGLVWNRAVTEMIRYWHMWAPNPMWLVFLYKGEIWTQTHLQGECHVNMKWPSPSQGKRPRTYPFLMAPILPAPFLFWTSHLQNFEAMHFCCLSHPVCGGFVIAALSNNTNPFLMRAFSLSLAIYWHYKPFLS